VAENFCSGNLLAAKERPLAKSNESDRKATAWLTAQRPFPELASALRSQANQVVEAWTGAVRAAIPPATELPSHELQEHLPSILTEMADAMDCVIRHDVDELMQRSPAPQLTAFQHRYDVRALMTEDRLLRRVIIERVKVALGRELIATERVALDTGIDTMLREAVRAQNRWAHPPTGYSKRQAVAVPTSTPVAQTQSPSLRSGPVMATDRSPMRFQGGNSMSPEKPTTTKSPVLPASLTRKAAIPVFVELPAQPQVSAVTLAPTVAAQVATGPAAEPIGARQDALAGTTRETATALGKLGERAAKSPQATAASNAVTADVNENPLLRAAAVLPEILVEITHEWIAVAAYYIWEHNGRTEGRALRDWLQAEARLRAERQASRQAH
jgi:Protein of unknown function (DUF2934)